MGSRFFTKARSTILASLGGAAGAYSLAWGTTTFVGTVFEIRGQSMTPTLNPPPEPVTEVIDGGSSENKNSNNNGMKQTDSVPYRSALSRLYVWVSFLDRRFERGEVVVLRAPDRSGTGIHYVKRVVALAGDVLSRGDCDDNDENSNEIIENDTTENGARMGSANADREESTQARSSDGRGGKTHHKIEYTENGKIIPVPEPCHSDEPGLAGALERFVTGKPGTWTIPVGMCWVEGDNHEKSRDSRSWGPIPPSLIAGRATHIIWPPSQWGKIEKNVWVEGGPRFVSVSSRETI